MLPLRFWPCKKDDDELSDVHLEVKRRGELIDEISWPVDYIILVDCTTSLVSAVNIVQL